MYKLSTATMILLLLNGCASGPLEKSDNRTAQRLIGKTETSILQCAGPPVKEITYGDGKILRYYKEASMFEESRPMLKGSQPGIHHGCWASLLVENGQITGVEFRTVPEGAEKEDDECEATFANCTL